MTPAEVLELKAWWAERLMPWHADESAKENPTVAVIALCDMVLPLIAKNAGLEALREINDALLREQQAQIDELKRQLDVIAMTESVKGA
jgi:hypothetical protein